MIATRSLGTAARAVTAGITAGRKTAEIPLQKSLLLQMRSRKNSLKMAKRQAAALRKGKALRVLESLMRAKSSRAAFRRMARLTVARAGTSLHMAAITLTANTAIIRTGMITRIRLSRTSSRHGGLTAQCRRSSTIKWAVG
jgi:glucosamine 6-phosphate synthetase-like amidotransferase/phosphosugar isomerase protein